MPLTELSGSRRLRHLLLACVCLVILYSILSTIVVQPLAPPRVAPSPQVASGHSPRAALLHSQLSLQFPYSQQEPIPDLIWQTWKVDMLSPSFPPKFRKNVLKWKEVNPHHTHAVLSDEGCQALMETLYASVPQVLRAYELLPTPILKADYFRYLILLARGGVYSDVDTLGLKPVDHWPATNNTYAYTRVAPQKEPYFGPGLVLGIEADPDRPDWSEWYARRIQFCQWTIQAKPGHPMLRELVVRIALLTLDREAAGTLALARGDKKGSDIMDWTGPGIFTDSVFRYFNRMHLVDADGSDVAHPVSWKQFTGLETPTVIDDVMVLPITGFSPGVGHMGSKETDDIMAFVHHWFKGSWKEK